MKVGNLLFFVKQLRNCQFLTKFHKFGLVWATTLVPTDKITRNTKFQTFTVVPNLTGPLIQY